MFVIVMVLCTDEEEIINIERVYGPYSSLHIARDELRNIANIYRRFPDDMKVYVWSNTDNLHIEINHYDKVQREMDIRTLEYYIEEICDILNDTTPDKITSLMESLDGYWYQFKSSNPDIIASPQKGQSEMFVIDSYIEIYEDDRLPYKVYGIYNSKELAIKVLDELKKYFQDNYTDDIIAVWDLIDEFAIRFSYIEPGYTDYKQYASLYYEIREISTPNSILNTTPDSIGVFIHKIMFQDSD